MDADIRSSLGHLPPDLHTIYAELYKTLTTKPGKDRATVFKNSLRWLLCAKRALNTEEFLCAVSVDPQSGRNESLVSKDLVLKICNNFIVFDSHLDTFRFSHLSVREFLEQKSDHSDSTSNALAAEVTLWTVLSTGSNNATINLLLELGWNANTNNLENLCMYADIYWAEHCKSAKEQRRSGKLNAALKHILLGVDGACSAITLWNKRVQKHLEGVMYWDSREERLEDTVPMADSATSVGLFVSCAFDFGELIEDLVEGRCETLRCVNQRGHRPLRVAIWNGSCDSLRALLDLDQLRTEMGQGDLTAAAKNWSSSKEVMALLLDQRGADVQITQEVVVVATGNWHNGEEVMALLLDQRGADVQITQEVVVAAAGSPDGGQFIQYLHRVTPILITDTVIQAAATSGKVDILRLFDQWAESGRVAKYWHDIARLCAAAKQGDAKAVLQLIQQGVPPDEQDIRGTAPLWHAANQGDMDTVRILLATNAVDVNATSISNRTPLFWTAACGHVEIVKLLLSHGAEHDYHDVDGRSPLMIARLYGQTKVVNVLASFKVRSLP